MNKKGTWDDLKKIILVLVFGIILIIFMIYFSGFLGEGGDKAACKNWVNTQASLKLGGVVLADLKSPCITSKETIKDSDKNKIYEHLAGSMYDCWDMYGAGKIDFYGGWFNTDTHCMICSEINVDEKVTKKRPTIDIDDFEIYLSNHNPPNHGETYAEFFTGTESAYIDFGSGEIPLKKEEPLYIIFMITKGDSPNALNNLGKGAIVGLVFPTMGAAIGGILGATIGSVVPVVGTASVGALGLKIGFWAGATAGALTLYGKKSYVYPSLLLVTGKESFEKGCEDYSINYKKKLFEGFKEGLSGGGGAGGKYE